MIESDAAQEAFVAVYRKLARLRKPAAFGSWIPRIARRQAISMLQDAARKSAPGSSGAIAARDSDDHLDDAAERLLAAVMRQPEHARQVVLLRYFDARTAEGCPRFGMQPQVNSGWVRLTSRPLPPRPTWIASPAGTDMWWRRETTNVSR